MCPGRFEALQAIDEEPLKNCPGCGLPCRRVVSSVSIKIKKHVDPERAAQRGFTTWKRTKVGEWEKVAGPGVDAIVSSEEDKRAISEEKKPKRKKSVDL